MVVDIGGTDAVGIIRIPNCSGGGCGARSGPDGPGACLQIVLKVTLAAIDALREEVLPPDGSGKLSIVDTHSGCKVGIPYFFEIFHV